MFEIYYVDGEAYEVSPDRLEEFLQRFPNAVKQQGIDFKQREIRETGTIKRDDDDNWFAKALKSGATNAELYDDADAVFDISNAEEARKLTDQELFTYIELLEKQQQSTSQLEELAKWSKAFKKYEDQGENYLMSMWMASKEEGVKGLGQAAIQSYRSMFNLESLKEGLIGAGTAYSTVTATAAGAGFIGGPYGSGVAALLSQPAAARAAYSAFFSSMNYGLETVNTFNQLLQEEIESAGMDFTPDAIREIMSNDTIRARIKGKARKRGLTIGTIEGITSLVGVKGSGAVSKSVAGTSKVSKIASNVAGVATATTIEAGGGSFGEFLGEKAIGREASGLDIILEGVSGAVVKGPMDFLVAAGTPIVQSSGNYFIGNKKVKKSAVMDYLNEEVNTAEDIATLDIKVENDPDFKAEVDKKIQDAQLEVKIDSKVEDINDRKTLVGLENERLKVKQDVAKEGIAAVPGAGDRLAAIEMQINEIIGKYAAVDGRGADAVAQRKTASRVEQTLQARQDEALQTSIEFAEQQGERVGLNTTAIDDVSVLQSIYDEKRKTNPNLPEKDVTQSDGFIVGNEIYINKTRARETGAISVGSHELLHGIIGNSFTNLAKNERVKLGKSFINVLDSKQEAAVRKRMKDGYGKVGDAIFDSEEIFTAFSDAIEKNEISFNETTFDKIRNTIQEILRKFGINKEFSNGRQVYNFLKDYQKSREKGVISQRAVEFAQQDDVAQDVKVSVSRDVKADIDQLGDGRLMNQQTWNTQMKDFAMKQIQEEKLLDDLIASKYKVRPVPPDFVKKVYSELNRDFNRFKVAEFNEDGSRKIGEDGKPVGNDSLFGFLNSVIDKRAGDVFNREYKQQAQTVDIDAKTAEGAPVTQIADETATQQIEDIDTDTPITDRARDLNKFDIELEDGLVDAEITAQVNDLIEQNPDNLEQQFNDLVKKDLRKQLGNAIGKVQRIKGKTVISPGYESFIRNEYEEIIKSLGVKTIRTSYKNLFDKERIGTEDVKKTDPLTGKVTYFRKGKFINKVNKPKFIKYFTQGGFTTLVERRNSLLARIAERKAQIAVDKHIEANSGDIDKVVLAKLRGLSRTAELTQEELKTFDAVKFSDTIGKKTKDLYDTGNFADRGRAFEQAIIDTLLEMGISKDLLRTRVQVATEEGGLADVTLDIFGERFNLEVKYGEDVPMGMVSLSTLDFNTQAYTLSKDENFSSVDFNDLVNRGFNDIKALRDRYNVLVEQYNTSNKLKNPAPKVNKMGDPMVLSIYNQLKKEGYTDNLAKTFVISKDGQPVIDHYQAKPFGGVEAIEIFGKGLYSLVENSRLAGVPYIKDLVKVRTNLYFKNTGRLKQTVDGKRVPVENEIGDNFVAFRIQFQNRVERGSLQEASPVSITNKADVEKMLGINTMKSQTDAVNFSKIVNNSRKTKAYHENKRGMSTFDFDETLIIEGENFITAKKGDETIKISSAEWPLLGKKYADEGYTFDFKDFVNVRGGTEGPLLQKMKNQIKKFGPSNVFVLTARMQESDTAIHGWLKTQGINIPIKNITGLGNSTGEAKAIWMLDKFAEGYNDMYFVDDALPNVEAVKNALEQLDVKSNVQQARVKFSDTLNNDFNKILEDVTGIGAKKRFGDVKARKRGADKGKFRFFIPPSHEDFVGLLYNFMGKGRKGDAHRDFFQKSLVSPLNRGYREYDTARQSIANDYKNLNREFSDVKSILTEKTADGDFSVQDAVRVYLWDKHGYTIPGLSEIDQKSLVDYVNKNSRLKSYAENINVISKRKDYVDPIEAWEAGNIKTDLIDATDRVGRAEFFAEFQENADIIFSEENLNKIEAGYGVEVKSALKDMLYRIKTGRNRPSGNNALVNRLMDYLNGAVGSVMFFNIRSAVLQQMSLVNYINFADNNIFQAAKAFANQKQYWADFAFIFNSDMLKQRRGGIQTDVNGAELAETLSQSKYPIRSLIRKLLQLGFLPTQIGDNIAIATGGSTFYRNRINTYKKQGLTDEQAQSKAFNDFQELTQSTQQSARPDMISQQQASPIGRLILAFQNVTSQFNRLGKKAFLDIKNRRITKPNTTQLQSDISNMSRIGYYFAVQNLVFYSLQTALFAAIFDDNEDDERLLKKQERLINGSIDSVLRGAGYYGAIVSTLKNMAIKFAEQREKSYNPDESAVIMEMLNLSPPVGIKARKLVNAEKTLNYNRKSIEEMDALDIDNPQWSAYTNYVEGVTNVPVNRLYNKTQNVRSSLDNENSAFHRILMFLGWSRYNLGIEQKKETKKKKQARKKSRNRIL